MFSKYVAGGMDAMMVVRTFFENVVAGCDGQEFFEYGRWT